MIPIAYKSICQTDKIDQNTHDQWHDEPGKPVRRISKPNACPPVLLGPVAFDKIEIIKG